MPLTHLNHWINSTLQKL